MEHTTTKFTRGTIRRKKWIILYVAGDPSISQCLLNYEVHVSDARGM